jgi:hypothetical protein
LPQADAQQTTVSAANWLIALGTLRVADPGRDLERAAKLARWLVDACYHESRRRDWEWYELSWSPQAALIPAGMWYAFEMLGDPALERVARLTTSFVLEHLFTAGVLMPVGSRGGWQQGEAKAVFDQKATEPVSVIELCRTAQKVSRDARYADYAMNGAEWYIGRNISKIPLFHAQTGACHRALLPGQVDRQQDAASTLACLLTHVLLNDTTPIEAEFDSSHIVIG